MDTLLPPVIGFIAASGTGKTTLMEGVVSVLSCRGWRVAAVKHGHHPAEPDQPGKDSFRFRQAGAATVLFAAPERWFLVQELRGGEEPPLTTLLSHVADHDLILVEGYKQSGFPPKIIVHRRGAPVLAEPWPQAVAVASDDEALLTTLPRLPLNDPAAVADFILGYFSLREPVRG